MIHFKDASLVTVPSFGIRAQRLAQSLAFSLLTVSFGSAMAQGPAASAAVTAAKPATAQAVAVLLTQHKVVKAADGKEQLLDATTVKPGDVLEYRATYTNTTDKAVTGVVATLPIPEGLEYSAQSAKPGPTLVQAATKNGVYGAEPLMRQVNGKAESVPYVEYRTLRWNLGQLPARGVAAVSARAKVEVFVPVVVPAPGASAAKPAKP